MKSLTAALAATIAVAAASATLPAQAQTSPDNQWRATSTTLSTLLQDGYKIVAVLNGAHGNAGPVDTIFVQRDQSAFKCIDPQQPDTKTRTPIAPAACFELVPPAGAASTSESK